ncbi:HAD-IIIA family hydrolase [Streptosporangium canum]|uniref:HAD-IIIA family hydrolase n=1 Tax=Streptosporangium canum TaxID=324952 RepID=UPI00343DE7C3
MPSRDNPAAVLFDRDGTLIVNVPCNRDPGRVEPVPGALRALDRIRRAGVPVGVITNQSGIGRGLIGAEEVADDLAAAVDRVIGTAADGASRAPAGAARSGSRARPDAGARSAGARS